MRCVHCEEEFVRNDDICILTVYDVNGEYLHEDCLTDYLSYWDGLCFIGFKDLPGAEQPKKKYGTFRNGVKIK